MSPKEPLISVIGATGTGKSQLAVELALALNGEIINADAMQMYRGLPIITNKITEEEAKGVPHHMLGFLDVKDVFRVGPFVREAGKKIQEIRSRGKMPIIVGGTHYYIQTLLFPLSLPNEDSEQLEQTPPTDYDELSKKYPILDAPTPELHAKLREVDPVMGARWHPGDRRKIRRSLQIYYASGCNKTASEMYAAQREAKREEGSEDESGSQFRNLVFWVHAESETLKKRLDGRIEKMIDSGMWDEIEEMESVYDELGGKDKVDITSGIWQSIGFKEFLPFLEARKAGAESDLIKMRAAALERMKSATRQYANAQVKWVRIKFMNAVGPEKDNLFLLDSTNVPKYDENVVTLAVNIAQEFLRNKPLPNPSDMSSLAKECLKPKQDYDLGQRPDLWVQKTCELCKTTTANEPAWDVHIKSNRHKRAVYGAKKRKEVEEYLRQKNERKAATPLDVQLVDVLQKRVEQFDA